MLINTALTRWFFVLVSLCIITLIMWNTLNFFNELKENERKKMQLWADAQYNVQENNVLNSDALINDVVLKVLQGNTTTPMILYSHKEGNYDIRNINKKNIDTLNLVNKFSNEYKPIDVYFNDELLQTIYYGNSPLINKIKYYPFVLILIMLLFFSAIYLFYRTSKSSEQNKLWAGMAKETAHQIGTPLSSLVGWAEILKTENVNMEYVAEIEKDIDRLRTITERFSKVGSVPTMTKRDLVHETHLALDYLKNRSSKLIGFNLSTPDEPIMVKLNSQLYNWTIENLVKNAIDAMKGKGDITIEIEKNSKHALVRITDTGRGISKRDYSKIFKPGFTSKKRGWGLGLSLAKRIIEEYHKGRIRVLRSTAYKGTTMEIAFRLLKD